MCKTLKVKFFDLGGMMLKANNGKANIQKIMANHKNLQPFMSIGANYEGVGQIVYKEGFDIRECNKNGDKNRTTEYNRCVRAFDEVGKNNGETKGLYSWIEWQDKSGFSSEENIFINNALGFEPSYIYKNGLTFGAFKVSTEENDKEVNFVHILESSLTSYNAGMKGEKKTYNKNGECKTTYKDETKKVYKLSFGTELTIENFKKYSFATLQNILHEKIDEKIRQLQEKAREEEEKDQSIAEKMQKRQNEEIEEKFKKMMADLAMKGNFEELMKMTSAINADPSIENKERLLDKTIIKVDIRKPIFLESEYKNTYNGEYIEELTKEEKEKNAFELLQRIA